MNIITTDQIKQECLKDVASTISFTPYINNQPAVSSSATITILRPGGETLVASTAATVNGTTGLISYQISAANTATLGENYVANWTFTVSGVVYYQKQLFDVVKSILSIPIIDSDLTQEQTDIMGKNESFSGAVDSATTTTIVDDELKSFADDYWNGGICETTLSSSASKQVRNITDFAQSTGTVTVGVAFGTTPTSSYRYILRRGFQHKIRRAFEEIRFEIFSRGNRCALILESSELKIPMIKKSLALICSDYMKEPGDKWEILSKKYESEYQNYMSKLVLQYDTDESGYISGSEKDKNLGNVRLKR